MVEHGVVGSSSYELSMGQGGCGVLVLLSAGLFHRMDHYGFVSFAFGCDFDLAPAYLEYRDFAEIGWYFVSKFPCRFPYGFASSRLYALVEASVLSKK